MSSTSTEPDIESQSTALEYLDGFPDVSEYIGSDRELALFRRFDVLSARNLLYLQARVLALEEALKQYDEEDKDFIRSNCKINAEKEIIPSEAALEALQVTKDWTTFVSHAEKDIHEDGPSKNKRGKDHYKKRLDTILEVQTTIKQYQEALILHAKVLQLDSPGSRALEVFKDWFNRKKPFAGKGNKLMENEDIAALRPSQAQDRLSKTLQKRVGWMFQKERQVPRSWGEMIYFSEKQLTRAVQILSVLFSALALTGAIVALHYIGPTGWRFGALGGFLLTFALALGILTDATTPEMFAATAAFAAVLVVFIATGLPH
ncbi:hypothetical protein N431DRAFT_493067 [Stipitochalara longipes BDJ]|nr:hypothetical protein N431DRAFT_493067 [Stipitochalara longipes BDJ]